MGSCENQVRSAIEYLACMGDKQHPLLFAALPFLGMYVPVVCIAQIHASTAFFGNASCQGDLDARGFNAAGFLVGSRSFDGSTQVLSCRRASSASAARKTRIKSGKATSGSSISGCQRFSHSNAIHPS